MHLGGRLGAQIPVGFREVVAPVVAETVHLVIEPVIGGPGYRQVVDGQPPDAGRRRRTG